MTSNSSLVAQAWNGAASILAGALFAACNVVSSPETNMTKPDAATRSDAASSEECDAGPPPAPNTSQCARACGGGCASGCKVLEARLYDRDRQCRGEPQFAECVVEGYLDNDFSADGQCAIDSRGQVFHTSSRKIETRLWNGWTECSNAFTQEVFAAPKCSELE